MRKRGALLPLLLSSRAFQGRGGEGRVRVLHAMIEILPQLGKHKALSIDELSGQAGAWLCNSQLR